MKSRANDICSKLAEVEGGARATWRTASKPPLYQSDADCARLSLAFSQFFVDKINQIRNSITTALQSLSDSHPFLTRSFVGNELTVFSPVTDGNVRRVAVENDFETITARRSANHTAKSCADVFIPIIVGLANLSSQKIIFQPDTRKQK